jgi:hypothetical protein
LACGSKFENIQRFYDHIDDCISRTVEKTENNHQGPDISMYAQYEDPEKIGKHVISKLVIPGGQTRIGDKDKGSNRFLALSPNYGTPSPVKPEPSKELDDAFISKSMGLQETDIPKQRATFFIGPSTQDSAPASQEHSPTRIDPLALASESYGPYSQSKLTLPSRNHEAKEDDFSRRRDIKEKQEKLQRLKKLRQQNQHEDRSVPLAAGKRDGEWSV